MKKLIISVSVAVIITFSTVIQAIATDYKFNMSYIYYGNSIKYTELVDSTAASLNEVAPNYFSLDTNGNLIITNAASLNFVHDMHARGIRVVPYLTNDWVRQTGINALNNMEALTSDIARAVTAYELDGINVDIENVTEIQSADYVEFIRLLREKLPAGKIIAVAVAANPSGSKIGWAGSYDYKGLANFCDYLMIMAYDEHYYGSKPGPVASYTFVENAIKYALTQVSKEKVVLGLPFFGRIWAESGQYPQGYGISNSRVSQLVSYYNGNIGVDSISHSACAKITVSNDDIKPVIGGRALSTGTYTIWFDNEQTLKDKLELVQKYDIMGAGSWSLGQEEDNTWNYYKLWLNGCRFYDIEASWAKDAILDAYMNEWVTGISPTSFAPNKPLTRAEAATILVRMLGYPIEKDKLDSFDDTIGLWSEDYINTARRYHLIEGIGNNLFAPDKSVTRQEIAVMLNNYLDYTTTNLISIYNDVSSSNNSWAYAAICALSDNGIITGYPDGSYRPVADITRAEMTALLSRIK